jgi:hypothetical protein
MGHILITGPGRSGTTFLVQLLTRLGCDTGFVPYVEAFDPAIRAGCELETIDFDLNFTAEEAREYSKDWPHVFKAPDWSWKLKGFLARGFVEIEHVILPFRDFDVSAKSRIDAGLDWMLHNVDDESEKLNHQAAVHAMVFGRVVEVCYLYHLPLHIIRFPELVQSADYCYQRLQPIFGFDRDTFKAKHKELAWPSPVVQEAIHA